MTNKAPPPSMTCTVAASGWALGGYIPHIYDGNRRNQKEEER